MGIQLDNRATPTNHIITTGWAPFIISSQERPICMYVCNSTLRPTWLIGREASYNKSNPMRTIFILRQSPLHQRNPLKKAVKISTDPNTHLETNKEAMDKAKE